MLQRGLPVSREVIHCLLQECTQKKDLAAGRYAHSLLVSNRLESVGSLGDYLIRLFALCGSLLEADVVFCRIAKPSVYTWHSIISAHASFGESSQAITLYHKMQQEGTEPDKFIFSCILKVCSSVGALGEGRLTHGKIIRSGLETNQVVQTTLVDMYAKCGSLEEAFGVFNEFSTRDAVLWGAMIAGYAQHGHGFFALELFDKMLQESIPPDKVTFLSVLKACCVTGAIAQGRHMHDHIITSRLETDAVIGNTIVDMYAKCGSLEDAFKVFDELPSRDMVSWGAMMAAYVQHGLGASALELLARMQLEEIFPDEVTFSCALKACASTGAMGEGRLIHNMIIESGFQSDVLVGNGLVDMYAKCGRLKEAEKVFDRLLSHTVMSWNTIIAGHAKHGNAFPVLKLFQKMQEKGTQPDKVTYLCTLKACGHMVAIGQGRLLHDQIIKSGLEYDLVLGNTLIDMFAKCGRMSEAYKVFMYLPIRDAVSWSAMLAGYAQHKHEQPVFELFDQMQCDGIEADFVIFSCILKVCSTCESVRRGRLTHQLIIKSGVELDAVIGNALVDMYAKCGSLNEACSVFSKLMKRDVVSWSAMIAGYAQHGYGFPALELFNQMQEEGVSPDKVTFASILKACTNTEGIDQGMLIHEQIARSGLESDVVLGNALVDMYVKCGRLEQAHRVFENLPDQDVVAWGVMIAGYVQHGNGHRAVELFEKMQQVGILPDEVAFTCILKACSSIGAIGMGRLLHNQIVRSGVQSELIIGNSLIDMYAKFGSLEEACKVFDKLRQRDEVSWNALITGYVQHDDGVSALQVFDRMQGEGVQPDTVTFTCTLKACGSVGVVGHGRRLHFQIIQSGLQTDVAVGNTLVDMYANCGRLDDASNAFDRLSNRDVVSWNAMIAGYAQAGNCRLANQCLENMQQQGLKPDGWTYTSILAACSHAGEVEEGQRHFKSMSEDCGLTPSIEHFNCMIELLGSAGCLYEAAKLLESMPILPDITGWITLLTACRTYNNIELGRQCFDQAILLDRNNAACYVLMSNIYANADMWEDVNKLRELRKGASAWKKPGMAWIETNSKVHEFIVADKIHSQREKIHFKLVTLRRKLKKEGYAPHLDITLEPIIDEDGDYCLGSQLYEV